MTIHLHKGDLPDGLGAMQGGASGFELVSAAPLSGPGLAKIRWSLRGDASGAALVYDDAQWQGLEVLPGPLLDARFEYLGADGTWQGEWQQPPVSAPAAFDEMGAAPAAVALAAGLHVSRLDGSPIVYNARDPWLPDFIVCRKEWAQPVLSATSSNSSVRARSSPSRPSSSTDT